MIKEAKILYVIQDNFDSIKKGSGNISFLDVYLFNPKILKHLDSGKPYYNRYYFSTEENRMNFFKEALKKYNLFTGDTNKSPAITEKEYENTKKQNKRLLEKLDLIVRSNQELEQTVDLTTTALKLACETIKKMCPQPLWIGGSIPSPDVKDFDYFIEMAKELRKK